MTQVNHPLEAPASPTPPVFPVLRVLPLPTTFTTGSMPILISPSLSISLRSSDGSRSPLLGDLKLAVDRTKTHLRRTRHQYLSPTRGSEFFSSGESVDVLRPTLETLHLKLEIPPGEAISNIAECSRAAVDDRPALEAYTLSISITGAAVIKSRSALGILRGLTTFEQLVYHLPTRSDSRQAEVVESQRAEGDNGILFCPFAPIDISDLPKFGWRGLMLDTSRNWFGLEAIRKLLDTMSLVKMNVFHWHITDSNSWPMDLEKYPELARKGAYSPSEKYTEDEIKALIVYAGERGIDVLLEIDVPGHTASIHASHPEHIASANRVPFSKYAHQPPAGQLRFATDETTSWTKGLMGEVVDLIGDGGSRYIGTGGDEVNVPCMMEDPITAESLKRKGQTLDQALNQFTKEVHQPIRAAGKTPVVWQEMALDHGPMPSLSKDSLVQIWRSSKHASKVIDKGFRIIHAPVDYFYLDVGLGGWLGTQHGSDSWSGPYRTWARMMSFDPYECARETSKDSTTGEMNEDRAKMVLGGQACLWAEQTDETNLESQVWPRSAAVADLFWTGNTVGGGYPRNTIEALPRMHDVRYRMVDRGVRAIPLQPHWCALRPELSVEGS